MAKLNLNSASVEDISRVSMIGKEKAQAIVDFREARGPFKSLMDLKHVPGFGDKLIEGLDIYFELSEEEGEESRETGKNIRGRHR